MGDPAQPPLVAALAAWLRTADARIAAAWLFGSQARGTAREDSDVDVAVLYSDPPAWSSPGGPFDLEGDLEKLTHKAVQVVVMNTAPVDLVHRVLRDGILLADRDRSRRIRFEVRARNEYFDLLPHLLRYRRRA
jgi:predicted nucleotidyltransferase